MSTPGLEVVVHGLRKEYPSRDGVSVVAIAGLDLEIAAGAQVCVVGRTGCGKSTLFRLLAGLEPPTQGSIRIAGRDPFRDFLWFRGKLGMVFQEDRLLPWRTALSNAALGLELLGMNREQRRRKATDWLLRLGLGDVMDCYPGQLSGGMRQRVALARAFVLEPQLVLADEAFGHLDEVTGAQLRSDFFALARQQHTTVLLVTHNLKEAIDAGERLLVLGRPGRLLADFDLGRELNNRSHANLLSRVQDILQRDAIMTA